MNKDISNPTKNPIIPPLDPVKNKENTPNIIDKTIPPIYIFDL